MPRISAGLLMYRIKGGLEVLLAHPGGPFFANKDEGSWSIPKGEPNADEDLLVTAQREFEEETGIKPTGPFIPLKPIKQKGGKLVHAWAFEGDCDPQAIKSNTFMMEWPPRSGRQQEFPEIDRAEFFELATARKKIKVGQEGLIEEFAEILTKWANKLRVIPCALACVASSGKPQSSSAPPRRRRSRNSPATKAGRS